MLFRSDQVRLIHVIEHVGDVLRTMEEIHRVLRPGGRLLMETPHYTDFSSWCDPSHKWHLNTYSCRYFGDDNAGYGYYSKVRFREVRIHVRLLALWRYLGFEALVNAWPFVDGITWAKGFDLKTGMPLVNENQYPPLPKEGQDKGDSIFVSPPFLGGTNWMPMSYSPDTGLFYIPGNHWAMDYWAEKITYKAGAAYLGQGFRIKKLYDDHVGILRAINPVTGKIE